MRLKKTEVLVTLTGPSGSGKSTTEKWLVNKHGFIRAISHTSRPIRINEYHGKDYYFVDKSIMLTMNSKGMLAEFIEYNDNYYGVAVDELMRSNVMTIEPVGLKQVKEKLKDQKKIISIFLEVSEDAMRERMLKRGDSEINVVRRIEHDAKHFGNIDKSDYDIIINVSDLTPAQMNNVIYDALSEYIDFEVFGNNE